MAIRPNQNHQNKEKVLVIVHFLDSEWPSRIAFKTVASRTSVRIVLFLSFQMSSWVIILLQLIAHIFSHGHSVLLAPSGTFISFVCLVTAPPSLYRQVAPIIDLFRWQILHPSLLICFFAIIYTLHIFANYSYKLFNIFTCLALHHVDPLTLRLEEVVTLGPPAFTY